jgi:hypothetical protein
MDLELSALGKPATSSNAGWTPERINDIINGIGKLMQQYYQLKGGGSAGAVDPQKTVIQQGNGITMPQVKSFAQQFLDNIIAQGNGDKKVIQVLQEFEPTIKQLRSLLG